MTVAQATLPIRVTPGQRHLAAGSRRFAAMLAAAFAITTLGLLAAAGPTNAWSGGEFSSSSEHALVALTNQSRAAAGLKALKVDATLTSIARSRSKDMIVRDYFSHNIPPSGKMVFHDPRHEGLLLPVAGENIGWNNYPDDVATEHDPAPVHGLARPPRRTSSARPGTSIGIGAYKGPTARRCGRSSSPTSAARLAEPRRHAEADSRSRSDRKPTPKPAPKPDTPPTPSRRRADAGPDARSERRCRAEPDRSGPASARRRRR